MKQCRLAHRLSESIACKTTRARERERETANNEHWLVTAPPISHGTSHSSNARRTREGEPRINPQQTTWAAAMLCRHARGVYGRLNPSRWLYACPVSSKDCLHVIKCNDGCTDGLMACSGRLVSASYKYSCSIRRIHSLYTQRSHYARILRWYCIGGNGCIIWIRRLAHARIAIYPSMHCASCISIFSVERAIEESRNGTERNGRHIDWQRDDCVGIQPCASNDDNEKRLMILIYIYDCRTSNYFLVLSSSSHATSNVHRTRVDREGTPRHAFRQTLVASVPQPNNTNKSQLHTSRELHSMNAPPQSGTNRRWQ